MISRNIEVSFLIYEKNCKKIVSGPQKFQKILKKIFDFAPHLLNVSVAELEKFSLSRVKSVSFFFTYFHFPCWGLWFIRRFYGLRFFSFQVSFWKLPTWNFRKLKKLWFFEKRRNAILFWKNFWAKLRVFQKFVNFSNFWKTQFCSEFLSKQNGVSTFLIKSNFF